MALNACVAVFSLRSCFSVMGKGATMDERERERGRRNDMRYEEKETNRDEREGERQQQSDERDMRGRERERAVL